MTFRSDERITETSSTTGTGSYVLDGAATGFQAFSVLGSGNHCSYFATDDTSWEAGIGRVLIGPNRLERTHVLKSSTGTAAINWGAGTKTIQCGLIGALAVPRKLSKNIAGTGTTTLTQDEGLYDIIEFTGTLTGNRTIQVDSTPWIWQVFNNTTGAFTLTFKVAGLTGISISRGQRILAYCDGSDVRAMSAGAPFVDNEPIVVGSADATKKLRLEVDGFTTGTTRVATAPDADFTMVGVATTQTLTNKTLTSPTINTPTISGGTISGPTLSGTLSGGTITSTISGSTINADSNSVSNIDQGNLKTTTASGNISINQNASGTYTLTGGTYSWWTGSSNGTGAGNAVTWGGGDIGAGIIGVFNEQTVGPNNFYVDERYMQASPPYNLGNGDIPLFVFVLIDATQNIRCVSVAPDPTWAYHGPTDIRPERIENGKAYRRYREIGGVLFTKASEATKLAFLRGEIPLEIVEREITQEIKNADKDLFPHPWVGNNLSGLTVVMLDPLSALVSRFQVMHDSGGTREIRNLILQGKLNIGSIRLSMNAPAAVMPVAATLK